MLSALSCVLSEGGQGIRSLLDGIADSVNAVREM
jgi:hypothetical protein